jgi:hypothetical protein
MTTISGSSFARIHQCPGSVRITEGLTQPASPEMLNGTIGHWKIAEAWKAQSTDGLSGPSVWALSILRSLEADGFHVQVERHLSVTLHGVTNTGTVDVLATKFRPEGGVEEVRVLDWKMTEDKTADTEDHLPQLIDYGYLARSWARGDASTKITVQAAFPNQQRLGSLVIASGEMGAVERTLEAVAALKDAPLNRQALVPGKECGNCPARTTCPAHRFAIARVTLEPTTVLDGDDLPRLLQQVRAGEGFLEDLKKAIKLRLATMEGEQQTTESGSIYMKRFVRDASPSFKAATEWLKSKGRQDLVDEMAKDFAMLPSVPVEYPELRKVKK